MGNPSNNPAVKSEVARFCHAERGMTRFPPNVESVTVERAGNWTWLIARRNDVELRFPLAPEDVAHLIALLSPASAPAEGRAA